MVVKKEQIVGMFVALGFKTATAWDDEKLQKNIKKLPDLDEDAAELDKDNKKLYSSIVSKLEAEEDIVVEEEKTDKKDKTAKAEKATKKEKKASKKGEVDKFGFREGSQASKVAACLTAKPKSMSALMEAAGVKVTCYDAFSKLIKAKKIKKTEEGYCLIK